MGHPHLYRVTATGLRLSRRTVLLAGLAAFGARPALAQVETGAPGETLDEITARGTIRIGVYSDFAPYSYLENGEIKGTDVEIGKLIAEALKVKPDIRLLDEDENVDGDLRNRVWRGPIADPGDVVNVMLHMPIDPDLAKRNDMVVMGGAYATEKTVLAWSKTQLGDIPTMTDFTEYPIAVANYSAAAAFLGSFAGGALKKNIAHFPTIGQAVRKMLDGDAAGVMGPMAQLEFFMKDAGEKRSKYSVSKTPPPGSGQGTWAYGFAVRTNYRDLYYAVEQALADGVADGRIKAIFEKAGLTYNPPPPPQE